MSPFGRRKERKEMKGNEKGRCKPVFSSLHSLFYPVWLVPQSEDHFGYWKYHMQEKHCNLGAARMFSDSMNLAGMRLPWAKPVTKSSKIARFFFSPVGLGIGYILWQVWLDRWECFCGNMYMYIRIYTCTRISSAAVWAVTELFSLEKKEIGYEHGIFPAFLWSS